MTDGTVRIWDLMERKVSWSFQADSNVVDVISFSPDGNLLATAGRGAEIRVWERGDLGRWSAAFSGLAATMSTT
jgi:WD40 repeat protein